MTKENQQMADYIEYVENKISIDEIPMTFAEWKQAELDLAIYNS